MKKQVIDKQMVDHLMLYIDNSREIYALTEWLQRCVTKRMIKRGDISVEHLAGCSTMQQITRAASKMVQQYDGVTPSMADRKEAGRMHAAYIIECANYLSRY